MTDINERVGQFLKAHFLGGVRHVFVETNTGFRAAISRVFKSKWQRCHVHWICNVIAHVFRDQHNVFAPEIRQAFDQPHRTRANEIWHKISELLRPR